MEIYAEKVRRERKKYRVLLDGKDVTKDCVAASDTDNWVDLITRLPDGSFLSADPELEENNRLLEAQALLLQVPFTPLPVMPDIRRHFGGKVTIEDLTNL